MFPTSYFAASYYEPDYWPPGAVESTQGGDVIVKTRATIDKGSQDDRDLPIILAALFQRIFNQ